MSVIKSFCACPRLFIQDCGFVDHWPRVSKSFKKYPEFCFIKWWNGSQVLRKEFRLNSNRKQPPSLSPGNYLQFNTLWVPVRCFFSRATRSFVFVFGRRPNGKHAWKASGTKGISSYTRQWKKNVACLYPLSPWLVHQEVPWKSLKERAVTTAG